MSFLDVLSSFNTWIALLTLTFLEIVLGIDNIVFISIISSKIKENEQKKSRNIGLVLAMIFRIALLFGIKWVTSLNNVLFSFNFSWLKGGITGQSIIIFCGGIFLLYKSVSEIHHKLESKSETEHTHSSKKITLYSAILQIALLNIVFSFDSILTAVGLVSFEQYGELGAMTIMILSVIVSISIMMSFAGPVSNFVGKHPTIQILGLSFLILIGVMLLAESSHLSHLVFLDQEVHSIPKGYLYFSIFFSLAIEFINMRMKKNGEPVQLKHPEHSGK